MAGPVCKEKGNHKRYANVSQKTNIPKSSKGPRDELAAAAKETKVPARDNSPLRPAALDPQVRHQMIARAAYCRAEQRGFAGGTNSQFHD
jgi:hypothetical protein